MGGGDEQMGQQFGQRLDARPLRPRQAQRSLQILGAQQFAQPDQPQVEPVLLGPPARQRRAL